MRPCDGVPRRALESQVLMARGLPPDSAMMIFLTPGARSAAGRAICSACAIQRRARRWATSASMRRSARPPGRAARRAGGDVGGLAQRGEVLVGGRRTRRRDRGQRAHRRRVAGLCSIGHGARRERPERGRLVGYRGRRGGLPGQEHRQRAGGDRADGGRGGDHRGAQRRRRTAGAARDEVACGNHGRALARTATTRGAVSCHEPDLSALGSDPPRRAAGRGPVSRVGSPGSVALVMGS